MKTQDYSHLRLTDAPGLSAEQVAQQQQSVGKNQLAAGKADTLLTRIGRHLSDISSLVLLFAVGLSGYMALFQNGGWTKPLVIGAILLINVVIGIAQESAAEKALAALRLMSSPMATVHRDGRDQAIDATNVVPGDLLVVNSGDRIATDGVVLTATQLRVDEAVLTGESEPVAKQALTDVAQVTTDQQVFSGTAVTDGRALIQVVATGMATEIGHIAGLLNRTKKQMTPLQVKLNRLSWRLTTVALIGGVTMFLMSRFLQDHPISESLMIGISLAVAAVPETLPIIVTISMAFGVKKMAEQRAIMRRVNAVETIGGVNVIAADKTGTLTKNQMTITDYWVPAGTDETAETGLERLQTYLGLATNAVLTSENGEEVAIGDSTELAIVRWLQTTGRKRATLEETFPRVGEAPFNSTKKTMATYHRLTDGRGLIIVKGALDRLPVAWESDQWAAVTRIHDQFAAKALRVLAMGYRVIDRGDDPNWQAAAHDLIFGGMVGMIDPPRDEVIPAIQEARRAGIVPVMITGDHMATAAAIATNIGLMRAGDRVVSGEELDNMSDQALQDQVPEIRVYARVSPEDKIRIVQAWQHNGATVAMTGDGVNDAPALKAADVGIAMGITGTEVAKGAADMILTDDNFATIISAVSRGRTVYQNILKAVEFLVGVNFAQILLMVLAVAFGWGVPLLAEQLLVINVLADGIPGFYLSREPGDPMVMDQPPVKKKDSLFAWGLGRRIGLRAVTFTLLSLGLYALGRFVLADGSAGMAQTMLFVFLAIGSMIDIYAIKSQQPLTIETIKRNPALNGALVVAILIIVALATIPPLMTWFHLQALSPIAWGLTLLATVIPTMVLEARKRWASSTVTA